MPVNSRSISPPATVAACLTACLLAGTPTSAQAQETDAGWEVAVTPYIWFTGLEGEIASFPNLQPVDVDINFTDVVSNMKFAAMGIVQVRRGRFVAVADTSYVDLGTTEDIGIRDPGFLSAELDTDTFTSTVMGGYRAVDNGPMFFDVLAGGRLTIADTTVALTSPTGTIVGESQETWLDPVIGARVRVPLGPKWSTALYGDMGGFGVASDFTWQVLGVVQYDVSRNWTIAAGWRHYQIDYTKGGFIYDVTMSGPLVGATIRL